MRLASSVRARRVGRWPTSAGSAGVGGQPYVEAAQGLGAVLILAGARSTPTWFDESGNSHDATIQGAPAWSASGGPGASLPGYYAFDGTDDAAFVGDPALLRFAGAHSLVWWERTDGSAQVAYAQRIGARDNFAVRQNNLNVDELRYRIDADAAAALNTPAALVANEWMFWMARYTGAAMEFWTITPAGEPSLVATTPYAGAVGYTEGRLLGIAARFGASSADAVYRFRGDLAGVLAFDRSLPTSDFRALWEAASGSAPPPPPPPPPAPSGDFDDGYDLFGLEGNAAFNTGSPTLKDGTALTGDLLSYYNAVLYWAINAAATTDPWVYVNPVNRFGNSDAYSTARYGQQIQTAILNAFRLTGDLRLLDRLIAAYNAMSATALTTSWLVGGSSPSQATLAEAYLLQARSTQTLARYTITLSGGAYARVDANPAYGNPWSPHLKVLVRGAGGLAGTWQNGTDLSNEGKLMAIIPEFAWTLHLNRGKTSPAGHNYGTLADTWRDVAEGYAAAWMGDRLENHWSWNYRGDEWTGSTARRAPTGAYPMHAVNGSHSAMDNFGTHRYLGLLGLHGGATIESPQAALDIIPVLMDAIIGNALMNATSTLGPCLVFPRNRWLKDADTELRAGWATYCSYMSAMFVRDWLTGAYRTRMTRDRLHRLARSWAAMTNTDGSTLTDIGAGLPGVYAVGTDLRLPVTTSEGVERYLRVGAQAGGGTETTTGQAVNAFSGMAVFEDQTESTKLSDALHTNQVNTAGGLTTPNSGLPASYLFVQAALEAIGDLA